MTFMTLSRNDPFMQEKNDQVQHRTYTPVLV
jgi:hypothetical protein